MNIKEPINNKDYYDIKKGNTDNKTCILKFSECHDKYPLHELRKKDLKAFINYAKKVEKLQWALIKTDTGLKFEYLKTLEVPNTLEKDVKLFSMRIHKKRK